MSSIITVYYNRQTHHTHTSAQSCTLAINNSLQFRFRRAKQTTWLRATDIESAKAEVVQIEQRDGDKTRTIDAYFKGVANDGDDDSDESEIEDE